MFFDLLNPTFRIVVPAVFLLTTASSFAQSPTKAEASEVAREPVLTRAQKLVIKDVRQQFSRDIEMAKLAIKNGTPNEAVFEKKTKMPEFEKLFANPNGVVLKINQYDSEPAYYLSKEAFLASGIDSFLPENTSRLIYPTQRLPSDNFDLEWIVIENLSDVTDSFRARAGLFPKNRRVVAVEHNQGFWKGGMVCSRTTEDTLYSDHPLNLHDATNEFIRVWNEAAVQSEMSLSLSCFTHSIIARGGGRAPVRVGKGEINYTLDGIRLPDAIYGGDLLSITVITIEDLKRDMNLLFAIKESLSTDAK